MIRQTGHPTFCSCRECEKAIEAMLIKRAVDERDRQLRNKTGILPATNKYMMSLHGQRELFN